MTDTRLPEHFLTSPTLDGLSSDAFRVYVNGLMWSVTHGTDGLLPERALRYLHPDGKRSEQLTELVTARLWEHDDAGYHVPDFLKYQTPATQIEKARATDRERKRIARQQQLDRAGPSPDLSVSDRTSDRTADRTSGRHTEDRTETVQGQQLEKELPAEVEQADPDPALPHRCSSCSARIRHRNGMCETCSDAVIAANSSLRSESSPELTETQPSLEGNDDDPDREFRRAV